MAKVSNIYPVAIEWQQSVHIHLHATPDMRLNHIHTHILSHLIHSSHGAISSWHQDRRINRLLTSQHTIHHVMHAGHCRGTGLMGTILTDRSAILHAWCVGIDHVVHGHFHLACFCLGNGGC